MAETSPARDDQGRRHRRQADEAAQPQTRRPRADDGPLFAEPAWQGGSPDARFFRFVENNPHVLRRFVQLALELQATGVERYGAKAIWETLRYEALRTRGETIKLNNNYVSRLARLAMATEPRLKGFFETRTLPSRPVQEVEE